MYNLELSKPSARRASRPAPVKRDGADWSSEISRLEQTVSQVESEAQSFANTIVSGFNQTDEVLLAMENSGLGGGTPEHDSVVQLNERMSAAFQSISDALGSQGY